MRRRNATILQPRSRRLGWLLTILRNSQFVAIVGFDRLPEIVVRRCEA